jgi:hypothetical protein
MSLMCVCSVGGGGGGGRDRHSGRTARAFQYPMARKGIRRKRVMNIEPAAGEED